MPTLCDMPDQQPEMRVVKVPMLDTGLGREAGFASDADLIAAAEEQRAEMRALLSPETADRLDAAEREATCRFIEGIA
jgi:hypothetical protein